IAVGRWHETDTAPGEELVVVCHGPDSLEIHCHGGTAAAEAVLRSLAAAGAERLEWPAWAGAAGASAIDLEARLALARAAGPRAARILCQQLAGSLAAAIDELGSPSGQGKRLLRAARVGLRLTEPWRVVVTGPVNAGKSSLVNALAGHARSIVASEPGTTRDLVTTRLVMGGWEIDLIDTAGDRDGPLPATEQAGISLAAAARATADLVLRVAVAGGAAGEAGPGELAVLTKADLTSDQRREPPGAVVTSATTGLGIDGLTARIVAALVPEDHLEPGLLDGPVPFTPRQVALIRGRRA
ncbi:MAG: GTP-binding protein, partial [Planctomycetes bacterium]|nr:GTP-binding protein [Planctomycetota bacterium]